MRAFLSQNYQLKAIADYEGGEDAVIPKERVLNAMDAARQFIDYIAGIIATEI